LTPGARHLYDTRERESIGMRIRTLCAALAVAALAAPAAQASEASSFNIMGPSRCGAWPKSGDITSATKAVPLNWALGFLSGWAAQANLALLDVVEPEAVDRWLTDFCQKNPEVTLPAAVRELERDLEAKLPPPPAPPPAPTAAAPAAEAPAKAAPAAKAKPKAVRRAPARRKPRT
jgi:hypothetical protein